MQLRLPSARYARYELFSAVLLYDIVTVAECSRVPTYKYSCVVLSQFIIYLFIVCAQIAYKVPR
jgi:hypothetical protein